MNVVKVKKGMILDYMFKNNMNQQQFCKHCQISTHTFRKIMQDDPTVRFYCISRVAIGMGLRWMDIVERKKELN